MSTPILLDNLDLLPIYHHIRPGIWLEWSYPKASIHLKIWGCKASPLIPSSPFPFPSPPVLSLLLPFPSPPLFLFPRRPQPLYQLRGGERCKLPQWGLKQSPSRQTIWCIFGPKGAAMFCVSFFVGNTGPSYHSRIVCENDWNWIELAISSRLLCIKLSMPQRVRLWSLPGSAIVMLCI